MKLLKNLLLLTAILPLAAFAGKGTWKSVTLNTAIRYTTTEAKKPALDKDGKRMTVVYLENLACEKVGRNSNKKDVNWLLKQGYCVIELDYGKHANAVSPLINKDIIAINSEMRNGTFCGMGDISQDRAYILFEGYRILRDVSYHLDDKDVYNMHKPRTIPCTWTSSILQTRSDLCPQSSHSLTATATTATLTNACSCPTIGRRSTTLSSRERRPWDAHGQ